VIEMKKRRKGAETPVRFRAARADATVGSIARRIERDYQLPNGSVSLFHLPGDVVIDRPGFKFFFPVTTMLIISVVLSLLAWLMRR
jgi:hypothetical protein